MKQYSELRKINVNEHIERKGNLSYLSWAWAVDTLLCEDPMATWTFHAPVSYGETMMVFCTVTALGKSMTMHLPVMDNKNNAVKNPDSRKISDAMMRCLAKCIATFGIGLYIYAGDDLPSEGDPDPIDLEPLVIEIQKAVTMDDLKKAYIAGIKACKNDQAAQKVLESAKDSRKIEISNEAHEAKENQQ